MRNGINSAAASAAFMAAFGLGSPYYGTASRRPPDPPLANLSRFHPDYGMTPHQHALNKRAREAGRIDFVDKAALTKRRKALLREYGL